ncbi:HDOD domain-containing protein [Rubrivivax sp. A210]|uniref:HDOD domain-containing protein n=1 Tax=Rubrivivax sp. A210 TaxID=2772301 RepID=UPI001917EDD0|nr:HDOD domain-containing protein [Rubrivivax sp. A210]CAD5372070.1 HDOD domain-containing protein [Rubrivivax sp. A210]
MTLTISQPPRTERVAQELDLSRKRGELRKILIPPCPDLLVRLQAAMAETEPDLSEIARIAGSDVAMSATLLRNANSPLHAVGQPVATVGQAMNRLGLIETAAVLTGFLVRHAIPVDHPQLRHFWEHAAIRAATLHFIARHLPGLVPELAHLYGLFCHVGMPVLLQSVRGYGGTLVEARARIDRSFIATENANHRTDHAVVGALVARTWHLEPTLVAAIRLHHDLESLADDGTEAEIHTLVAAGLLAEYLMRRREGLDPENDWTQFGAQALAWLQLSADDLADWTQPLQAELDAL